MNRISLLFPGQGSQYIGMGKKIFDRYTIVKEIFEEANESLGFDLTKLCFEGSMEDLTKTENAQPAILTVGVAAFNIFMNEMGIIPQFAVGHSIGEITALTCAGAIKFSDAVKIVRKRGIFMRDSVAQGEGSMLAISGVDVGIINSECNKVCTPHNIVTIANYNSPVQIVISGHKKAINEVGNKLKKLGAYVTTLIVSGPFHSPLMQPASNKLKDELKKYKYKELGFPVISNVDALPYKCKENIIENLAMQVVSPVKWQDSMRFLRDKGSELIIDMGPKSIAKNLMKQNISNINSYEYENENEREDIYKLLNSQVLGIKGETQFSKILIKRCIAIAVCTKNRNWNNVEYEEGVIKPYKKIKQLQEEIEMSVRKPSLVDMTQALEMLRSVFNTKKVPIEEQIERFNEIFNETGTRDLFLGFEMPVKLF